MPASFSENYHAAAFILSEEEINYSRDNVTIKAGTPGQVVKQGTVMAKLTASPYKWVPAVATAGDGSQTAAGILIYDTDITADAPAVMLIRTAQINSNLLIWDTSINDSTKKAAAAAQLATVGIIVRA